MQLTSGGSVCTPMFEPEQDSLSMHCDSRTILINGANYCYHLIVKIYRLTRYLFQTNASFFEINVSQGSVATRLRCGGIFHDFIANLPLTLQRKEF